MNVLEQLNGGYLHKMMYCFKNGKKAIVVTAVALLCSPLGVSASQSNTKQSVMPPVVYNDVKSPPPIRISLNVDKDKKENEIKVSDIVALLALISSLMTIFITIYLNNKNTKRSITETFWMREILIPQFLDRFFLFINDAPIAFKAANDLGDFFSSYALNELNELTDRSSILSVGCDGLGSTICEVIENFEEGIMDIGNFDDFSLLLVRFASKVVNEIKTAQIKMK